jgi:hypothetical protein
VARAKSTERAEARRKYRAYLQAQEEAAGTEYGGAADEAGPKPTRSRDPRSQAPSQPAVRMGMMAAARAAYRTPHYIDDIRTAPALIFRSNAIWPVAVLCIAAGAYFSAKANSDYRSDAILTPLIQFLFYPVPLLPPMIAGFFAPRSTWLAGVIASFIATMTLVVVIGMHPGLVTNGAGGLSVASEAPSTSSVPSEIASATPSATALVTTTPGSSPTPAPSASPNSSATPTPSASPTSNGTPAPSASASAPANTSGNTSGTNSSELFSVAINLLAQSLAFGALMAALAGWYKRFLSLTSGPRKPPASRSGGGRPPQRRPATKR